MTEFPSFERFKAWLARKPQDDVLTEDWDSSSCPLCLFLNEHGADEALVTPSDWSTSVVEPTPLPNWAREVVYWMDLIRPRSVTPGEIAFVMELPGWTPARWGKPRGQVAHVGRTYL